MYINNSSLTNKKKHSVILESDYMVLGTPHPEAPFDNSSLEAGFEAAFKRMVPPEQITKPGQDEFSLRARFAIYLSNDPPHQVFLLTAPDKAENYIRNEHIQGIKQVNVKSGDDALNLIETYWEDYKEHKASYL